jgi:dynein heavy chain
MNVEPMDQIEEARTAMLARVSLWRALFDWERLTRDWQATIFEDINAKEISKQADIFTKIVAKSSKELDDDATSVRELKKMVKDFNDAMPIVQAFKNDNLEVRHWRDIKTVLNLPEEDEIHKKQFTLGDLVHMGVADVKDELQMISTTATQEADIEAQMKDIEERWKEVEFNTKPQAESSPNAGVTLLADNSKLQELLDDTLTQTVNLLGNRFVKYHLDNATKLSDRLNNLSETYDLWREAQRGWLYLDNIFASAEIRGDCPAEA